MRNALTAALCLLFPVLLSGQDTGLLRLDKKNRAPQNDIVLWGGVEEGRFRPAYDPFFQWSAGTEARLVRHGRNASWFGTVSLEQMSGKYNRSSLFVEPDYFPMDFLDFTSGKGSRQTGFLESGFLGDLSDLWAAGLRASVRAANDTKRTAFRHSSFGMELELEPVLTFFSDDDACIVSSYLVRLRTEKAKSDPSGDSPLFFDQGMSYGAYVPDLSLFPVREFAHGFNGEYHSPEFSLGFGITWKRGRAGEDYNKYRFPGSTLNGFFETIREGFEVDRTYRISYRRMRDQLREVFGKEYASLSDRIGRNLNFQAGLHPHEGILKCVSLDLDGNHWTERAVAPPLWDQTKRIDVSATLQALLSKGAFDVDFKLTGGKGGWIDRGATADDAEGIDPPFRLTENWLRKTEYWLAPRIGTGGTLTWRIPAVKGLSLQLDAYWVHAFDVIYLGGKNRETVTLKIGYSY